MREAQHLDAKVAEQLARNTSRRHARRRLTRGRSLEHVADVGVPVLQGAGEVGVARPETGDGLWLEAFLGGGHLGGPVDVVLVLEHERHRAADGKTATDAADDAGNIGLDLLPPASAMPALAAGEVAAQVFLGDLETRRKALDHHCQLRPMGFARGQKSQHTGDHRKKASLRNRAAGSDFMEKIEPACQEPWKSP